MHIMLCTELHFTELNFTSHNCTAQNCIALHRPKDLVDIKMPPAHTDLYPPMLNFTGQPALPLFPYAVGEDCEDTDQEKGGHPAYGKNHPV